MRATCLTVLCLSTLLAAAPVHADTVTFTTIPGTRGANDMSPDGRYIVGQTIANRAYVYDAVTQQMTILPPECAAAIAVSDDGTVVLGDNSGQVGSLAQRWTASSGVWTSLGHLPNANTCPSLSTGYELSADGSIAVGLSWDGCQARAFRWTAATGMIQLQVLGVTGNRASVVSGNGNVIGGFARGPITDRTPAIWFGGGAGQLLDPNAEAMGEIHGINDAGSILLGDWNGAATMWTYPGLVRTQIANGALLPGWRGIPQDIAADGTIVGFDILGGNRRAWIRPAGNGPMIDLNTYVTANGGTVPSGMLLEVCQAISNDGRRIIGHGMAGGAWMVEIEPSIDCPGDVPGTSPGVDVDDMLAVIVGWGCAVPPGPCPADVDGSGVVDVNDLLMVITAWGPCPGPLGACCTGLSCSQMTQANCTAAGGTFLGDNTPCGTAVCDNNDHCSNAIDITANINGGAVLGDSSTATPSFGGGDTELPAGSPSCQFNQNPIAAHSTVWYSLIAPANGTITLALCNSVPAPFHDSILALYSGSCGALLEVACGEDDCATPPLQPLYSRITASGLTPGATYRVCVMNPGDWLHSVPGPFVLNVTSP